MNNKELRTYDLILMVGNDNDVDALVELADIDFNTAMEVWEYQLTRDVNAFGETDVFASLQDVSESKLRAALLGNTALLKLVYNVSPQSCTGANLDFLAGLIVASKITEAEEILKMVKSNATGDFSERMRAVVDKVFELSMGKTGTRKANLNHKQTILLFDYVSKMKSGTNKSLLTQRLKEL